MEDSKPSNLKAAVKAFQTEFNHRSNLERLVEDYGHKEDFETRPGTMALIGSDGKWLSFTEISAFETIALNSFIVGFRVNARIEAGDLPKMGDVQPRGPMPSVVRREC
jgi:hypothetical protein